MKDPIYTEWSGPDESGTITVTAHFRVAQEVRIFATGKPPSQERIDQAATLAKDGLRELLRKCGLNLPTDIES